MIFPEPTLFYTATIHQWKPLLYDDQFKEIIISSLRYLSEKNRIWVYCFVIMPNHIHLIVKILENDKIKENALGSLLKFSAHQFKRNLVSKSPQILKTYWVDEDDRKYRFWSNSTHRLEIFTDEMFNQKADYIHNNPVSGKWHLVDNPIDYYYSTARFYDQNVDDFGFLHNYYLE